MQQWCFLNDEFVSKAQALLPVQDLAVQRGYGVFDYIRVLESIPLFVEDHIDRLIQSSAALRIPLPYSREQLKGFVTELIERNGVQHSGIRITVTGGTSPDGYSITKPNIIIAEQPFQNLAPDKVKQGIRLVTHEHQRQLARIKTIDYLVAIWLGPMIREQGADDVLYMSNGLVTECPRANFFLLDTAGVLVTPHEGVLEGITRKNLIACATELNIRVEERSVKASELSSAKGAFISSTTKGLLPVASIDGKALETGVEIFSALQDALSAWIEKYKASRKTA